VGSDSQLKKVMEKAREFNTPLILCFIDYKKAFDSVPHNLLWIQMLEMGFSAANCLFIYKQQKATVRVAKYEKIGSE